LRGTFNLDAIKVFVCQQEIAILLEFVSFDQVPTLDLLLRSSIDSQHSDAVPRVRIDQVEANCAPVMLGAVKGHWARHKRKAKMSTPYWPLSHS
jgi:hypothetical protein